MLSMSGLPGAITSQPTLNNYNNYTYLKGIFIVMAKAETLVYTEKEMAAIEILRANRGVHLTYKELGIPTAVLTSLISKCLESLEIIDNQ